LKSFAPEVKWCANSRQARAWGETKEKRMWYESMGVRKKTKEGVTVIFRMEGGINILEEKGLRKTWPQRV